MDSKIIFNSSRLSWFDVDKQKFQNELRLLGFNLIGVDEQPYLTNGYKTGPKFSFDLNETYRGFNLFDLTIYSICNELILFKNEIDIELHQKYIHKWFNYAKAVLDDLDSKFRANSFSLVIMVNGHSLLDACLLALSHKYNYRFLCLENTANKSRVVWDNLTGNVVTYNLANTFFKKHKNVLSENQALKYSDIFKNSIFKNKREEHLSNASNKGIPFKKPFVLFIGQVYCDAAQLFALNQNFDNPIEVIRSTIKSCKELGLPIIIKLHPKELKGKSPVLGTLYNSPTYERIKDFSCDMVYIDYLNNYNTYKLIEDSRVVVTLNSQAGLEACLFDKPVLSYDNCFYSKNGFTYDYRDSHSLTSHLSKLISQNVNHNLNFIEAKKFYYIFFKIYCVENSTAGILQKTLHSISLNKKMYFKSKLLIMKSLIQKIKFYK